MRMRAEQPCLRMGSQVQKPRTEGIGQGVVLMIEIKRNCSSSIREQKDKITYGDFTISITGSDYEMLSKILDKYDNAALVLKIVIGQGIFSEYEQGKDYYES